MLSSKVIEDRYYYLKTLAPVDTPCVSIDGTVYKWTKDRINISSIPGILTGCTYTYGLEAKEGHSLFVKQVPMVEGGILHDKMGDSLDIAPELDFRDRKLTGQVFQEIERHREEHLPSIEVPLPGIYGNIRFSGKIDKAVFHHSIISRFEEWKFTNGGQIIDSYRVQTLIYAYFIHKWMDTINIPYGIKVWQRSNWSEEIQSQSKKSHKKVKLSRFPASPVSTENYIFSLDSIVKAERILQKVTDLFTGNVPCIPDPELFKCRFCRAYDFCSHRIDRPNPNAIADLRTSARSWI